MLDGCAAQVVTEFEVDRLAGSSVVSRHAHFDQAVAREPRIDLFLHAGRESVVADDNNRVEVVRVGAQRFALLDGEFDFWHSGLILRQQMLTWDNYPPRSTVNP